MTTPPRGKSFSPVAPVTAIKRVVITASSDFLSEAPMQGSQHEWQVRLRSLQERICELLIKNQQLRMALMEVQAREPWTDGGRRG
jgi:hypothetical protein